MTILISKPTLLQLQKDYEVSEQQIRKVLAWMNENVDGVTSMTELAEQAQNEVDDASAIDEELFAEVAFLFESVIDYGDDDEQDGYDDGEDD